MGAPLPPWAAVAAIAAVLVCMSSAPTRSPACPAVGLGLRQAHAVLPVQIACSFRRRFTSSGGSQ